MRVSCTQGAPCIRQFFLDVRSETMGPKFLMAGTSHKIIQVPSVFFFLVLSAKEPHFFLRCLSHMGLQARLNPKSIPAPCLYGTFDEVSKAKQRPTFRKVPKLLGVCCCTSLWCHKTAIKPGSVQFVPPEKLTFVTQEWADGIVAVLFRDFGRNMMLGQKLEDIRHVTCFFFFFPRICESIIWAPKPCVP